MRSRRSEMIEHATQIVSEVAEVERPFIVVAVAVAARIPGRRVEIAGEYWKLFSPVRAVPREAVKEDQERSPADVLDCDLRRPGHHHFLEVSHSSSRVRIYAHRRRQQEAGSVAHSQI